MNSLFIGLKRSVEPRKKPCLFIHDEVPNIALAQVFDPRKHSLDLFSKMTKRRARELAQIIYSAYPEGEHTLTVRNGKRNLAPLLAKAECLDRITTTDEEVSALLADLLFMPELHQPLCGTKNIFSLKRDTVLLARLNRSEIGDFATRILGRILIWLYEGQIIVHDMGFYGHDLHVSLVRENRLIAGVNYLDELPLRLKNVCLLIEDKHAKGALYDDAVELAKYSRLIKDTNEWHEHITRWMS